MATIPCGSIRIEFAHPLRKSHLHGIYDYLSIATIRYAVTGTSSGENPDFRQLQGNLALNKATTTAGS